MLLLLLLAAAAVAAAAAAAAEAAVELLPRLLAAAAAAAVAGCVGASSWLSPLLPLPELSITKHFIRIAFSVSGGGQTTSSTDRLLRLGLEYQYLTSLAKSAANI